MAALPVAHTDPPPPQAAPVSLAAPPVATLDLATTGHAAGGAAARGAAARGTAARGTAAGGTAARGAAARGAAARGAAGATATIGRGNNNHCIIAGAAVTTASATSTHLEERIKTLKERGGGEREKGCV